MAMQEQLPVLHAIDSAAVRAALAEHGAVMIRASGIGMQDFVELSDGLMTPMVHHATNTIERDPVGGDPSTATVNKGIEAIPLHREGSYAPVCPDLLIFYCERPASSGGETVVCDGAELLHRLDSTTQDFLRDLELYWSWEARPARWQQTLGARTKDEADKVLTRLRANLKPYEALDYRFDGDVLCGRFVTRAVVPSPLSKVNSFANSLLIHAFRPKSDYFARDEFRPLLADGNPFPADLLVRIRDVAEEVSNDIAWNPHEIVVIDNFRVMHGRRNFDDTQRRILLRMGFLRQAS